VCFAADPLFFRRGDPPLPGFYEASLAAYVLVAICTATFASALRASVIGPVRRGALFAGAIVASFFALVFTPLAAMSGYDVVRRLGDVREAAFSYRSRQLSCTGER
jgi:hypothetical protein